MSNIDKYHTGYERARADIEKTANETLSEIPEKFVKGVASLPVEIVRSLFRSSEEDRGYQDGLNGKEFKP